MLNMRVEHWSYEYCRKKVIFRARNLAWSRTKLDKKQLKDRDTLIQYMPYQVFLAVLRDSIHLVG